jgi:hypothetical protein
VVVARIEERSDILFLVREELQPELAVAERVLRELLVVGVLLSVLE